MCNKNVQYLDNRCIVLDLHIDMIDGNLLNLRRSAIIIV